MLSSGFQAGVPPRPPCFPAVCSLVEAPTGWLASAHRGGCPVKAELGSSTPSAATSLFFSCPNQHLLGLSGAVLGFVAPGQHSHQNKEDAMVGVVGAQNVLVTCSRSSGHLSFPRK